MVITLSKTRERGTNWEKISKWKISSSGQSGWMLWQLAKIAQFGFEMFLKIAKNYKNGTNFKQPRSPIVIQPDRQSGYGQTFPKIGKREQLWVFLMICHERTMIQPVGSSGC